MNMTWQMVIARLSEPSTYAGFGLLIGAFGVPTDKLDSLTRVIMAITGLVSVFLREGRESSRMSPSPYDDRLGNGG